ncbi:MAG TPA: mycofactocin-coupled SDR family oxidoreductase [Pseudonocardia sp.]|nr:mycofactocin-coupled SDR family oxidoreductase [Pseudonocardia sp.]
MTRFQDKVVLVTGAARGQGREHAVRFAREGADIIGLDLAAQIDSAPYPMSTPDDLAETTRLVEAEDRRMSAHVADVRDPHAVDKAVQAGLAEFGRIDVVLANAGIIVYGKAWELDHDQWHDVIDTNLNGVWHTLRAAMPAMIEAGRGGSMIVTSSFAGLRGPANAVSYVVAKTALVGMVRALANELGPHNIRINSIHPTTVDTPMVTNEVTYKLFRPDLDKPTREDALAGLTGMQALPIPCVHTSDISNAILWLASEEARYVTGVNLPVDGGAANK